MSFAFYKKKRNVLWLQIIQIYIFVENRHIIFICKYIYVPFISEVNENQQIAVLSFYSKRTIVL